MAKSSKTYSRKGGTRLTSFSLNTDLLNDAINTTGFPTEYQVQKILERRGWSVISNRYYIDDQKKIEREIDLLAVKNGIKLVISCKKSKSEFWTFMTSKNDGVKVLFEYKTKDRVINYFLNIEQETFRAVIKHYANLSSLMSAADLIRAFQQFQIKEREYTLNNDKQIYDSIITTIKAAEYEGDHSKGDFAYFMISIFNGEMIQKDFDDGSSKPVNGIKYINRHFIGDTDRYYCVHFIKFTAFDVH